MEAFIFNSKAQYRPGVQPNPATGQPSLIEAHVRVTPTAGFVVTYPDLFERYRLPKISSDALVTAWNTNPMQFWQNQVNFAVWCATSGCGVSAQDHLNAADFMTQSLYLFHTYFQTRRILTGDSSPICLRTEHGTHK